MQWNWDARETDPAALVMLFHSVCPPPRCNLIKRLRYYRLGECYLIVAEPTEELVGARSWT